MLPKLLVLILLALPDANASIEYLTSTSSRLQCHGVTKMGKAQCCCNGCGTTTWGNNCGGDLEGNTPGGACEANEVLGPEPDGQAYFGDSAPVNTGGICYAPGNCYLQNWQYKFQCCACPSGYQVYSAFDQPNCDPGALCVGCTGANEKLQGNNAAGFTCVTTPTSTTSNPCPSSTAFPNKCPVSSTSCDFYTCIEAKYHCGSGGYPIDYGYKYCLAFNKAAPSFSAKGKVWLSKTRLCLQQSLAADDKCKSNCKKLREDAVGSHTRCYIDNGVCDLALKDYVELLKTVNLGLLLVDSMVQAYQTLTTCAGLKLVRLAAAIVGVALPPALQGIA